MLVMLPTACKHFPCKVRVKVLQKSWAPRLSQSSRGKRPAASWKTKKHPSEFHFVWCLWPSHPLPTAVMVSLHTEHGTGFHQSFLYQALEWELCGRVWSASSKVNCGFKKKTGGGFLSVSACWVEIDGRKCFMVQGFLGSRGFIQFITTSFDGSFSDPALATVLNNLSKFLLFLCKIPVFPPTAFTFYFIRPWMWFTQLQNA